MNNRRNDEIVLLLMAIEHTAQVPLSIRVHGPCRVGLHLL